MDDSKEYNIFEEDFKSIAEDREFLVLSDVLKMRYLDESKDNKVNFSHLRIYSLISYSFCFKSRERRSLYLK